MFSLKSNAAKKVTALLMAVAMVFESTVPSFAGASSQLFYEQEEAGEITAAEAIEGEIVEEGRSDGEETVPVYEGTENTGESILGDGECEIRVSFEVEDLENPGNYKSTTAGAFSVKGTSGEKKTITSDDNGVLTKNPNFYGYVVEKALTKDVTFGADTDVVFQIDAHKLTVKYVKSPAEAPDAPADETVLYQQNITPKGFETPYYGHVLDHYTAAYTTDKSVPGDMIPGTSYQWYTSTSRRGDDTLTLTPVWVDAQATLTYSVDASQSVRGKVKYGAAEGQTVTQPIAQLAAKADVVNAIAADGFHFDKWTGLVGETPVVIADEDNKAAFEAKKTDTEHGIFEDASYTVTFSENNVTAKFDGNVEGETITVPADVTGITYTGTAKVPSMVPESAGRVFKGWSVNKAAAPGDAGIFQPGADFKALAKDRTGDVTLYAVWQTSEFTLTYDLDGGALPGGKKNPAKYTVDTETFTLINPQKTGYDFLGWSGTGISGESKEVTIEKGSTGDREYKANWKAVDVTLTFKANGGLFKNGTDTLVLPTHFGAKLDPETPVKLGYAISDWTPEIPETAPAAAATYTVSGWTPVEYTISYNYEGGALPTGQTNPAKYTIESDDITLKNPVKSGYDFAGWTGTGMEEPTMEVKILKGSYGLRSYTATWTPKDITLTLVGNGGKYPDDKDSKDFTQKYDTVFTPDLPVKEGYEIEGWDPALPAKVPAENTTYTVTGWNLLEYDIAYALAGGKLPEGKSNPVKYTYESDAITLEAPERDGYEFDGWTGTGLSEKTKVVTIAKNSTGDRSYTANWKAITYTITYDLKEGALPEGQTNPESYTIETAEFTLKNPQRAGYTFEGWTGTGLTEAKKIVTVSKGSFGDRSYTATWKIKDNTITFDVQGHGTEPDPITAPYTDVITRPDDPTAEGYDFGGWFLDAACTAGKEFTDWKMPADDTTLFAKWECKTVTISFDMHGHGGEAPESFSGKYSETIPAEKKPADPEAVTGYEFKGWFSDAAMLTPFKFETFPSKDTTIHAKWVERTYDFVLYWNYGGEVTTVKRPYSQKVEFPEPRREGYTLEGWYKDTGLTQKYSDDDLEKMKNTTQEGKAYAKWTEIEYTFTYHLNGGNWSGTEPVNPVKRKYTEGVTLLGEDSVSYNGHKFLGWFDAAMTQQFTQDDADALAETTGNVAVYARWELDRVKIEYEAGDYGVYVQVKDGFGSEEIVFTDGTYPDGSGTLKGAVAGNYVGYTFKNWVVVDPVTLKETQVTTSNTLTPEMIKGGAAIYSSKTFKAYSTENTYTITFKDDADGSGASLDKYFGDTYKDLEYTKAVKLPETAGYERVGYTFTGWQSTKDDILKPGQEVRGLVGIGTKELTAVWEPEPVFITYVASGYGDTSRKTDIIAANSADKITAGVETSVASNVPGQVFKKWTLGTADGETVSTDPTLSPEIIKEYSAKVVDTKGQYPCYRPVTFVAVFGELTYTVVIKADKDDADAYTLPDPLSYSEILTLTDEKPYLELDDYFDRPGEEFDHWVVTSAEEGTSRKNYPGESVSKLTTVNNDTVTLTAEWTGKVAALDYTTVEKSGSEILISTERIGWLNGGRPGESQMYDITHTLEHPVTDSEPLVKAIPSDTSYSETKISGYAFLYWQVLDGDNWVTITGDNAEKYHVEFSTDTFSNEGRITVLKKKAKVSKFDAYVTGQYRAVFERRPGAVIYYEDDGTPLHLKEKTEQAVQSYRYNTGIGAYGSNQLEVTPREGYYLYGWSTTPAGTAGRSTMCRVGYDISDHKETLSNGNPESPAEPLPIYAVWVKVDEPKRPMIRITYHGGAAWNGTWEDVDEYPIVPESSTENADGCTAPYAYAEDADVATGQYYFSGWYYDDKYTEPVYPENITRRDVLPVRNESEVREERKYPHTKYYAVTGTSNIYVKIVYGEYGPAKDPILTQKKETDAEGKNPIKWGDKLNRKDWTSIFDNVSGLDDNHYIEGWYIDEACTIPFVFADNDKHAIPKTLVPKDETKIVNIYAKWKERPSVIISYSSDADGYAWVNGTATANTETTEKVFTAGNPDAKGATAGSNKGYTFVNWTRVGAGDTEVSKDPCFIPQKSAATGLYEAAIYNANVRPNKYAVVFKESGETGAKDVPVVVPAGVDYSDLTYNVGFTLPAELGASFVLPDGYAFYGWKNVETGTIYAKGSAVINMTDKDKTVNPDEYIVTLVPVFQEVPVMISYETTYGGNVHVTNDEEARAERIYSASGDYVEPSELPGKPVKLQGGTAVPDVGYAFEKWTRSESTQEFKTAAFLPQKDAGVYHDAVYTAHFTPLPYSVKFYDRDEYGNPLDVEPYTQPGFVYNSTKDLEKVENMADTKTGAFVHEGFTFLGWSTTDKGDKKMDVDYPDGAGIYALELHDDGVDKVAKLYAVWKRNTYTMRFNTGGGSAVPEKKFAFDAPTAPTGDEYKTQWYGYTFRKWYEKDDPEQKEYVFGNMPANDVTLFADWEENTYAFTYNTAGGTWKDPEMKDVEDRLFSKSVIVRGPETIDRPGYEFLGWFDADGQAYTQTRADDLANSVGTPVLTAHWKALNSRYQIRHVRQDTDGTFETAALTEVQEFDAAGQYLMGATGTTTNVTSMAKTYAHFTTGTVTDVEITGDNAAAAIIQYNRPQHIFAYNLCGIGALPEGVPAEQDVYYEKDITSFDVTPTAKGYTFGGWLNNLPTDEKARPYTFGKMPDGAVTVYANWVATTQTVTFDANGGSDPVPATKTVTYGQKYGALAETAKTGYHLDGWFTEKTDGEKITAETDVTLLAPQTLYAHWSPNTNTPYRVEHYQQNLNDDGYPATPTETENLTGTSDSKVTPAVKTYAGFTAPTPTEVTVKADGTLVVKYYYTRNSYKVTVSKGTGVSAVTGSGTYKYGQEVPVTGTLMLGYENLVFTGNVTVTDGKFTMPADEVTLTASASPKHFTVTFDENTGSALPEGDKKKEVIYDSKYGTLPDETKTSKTGYTLAGWFTKETDGDQITADSDVKIQKDTTLYAHWTPNTYTVTFNKNSTEATDPDPASVSVKYDGTYGTLAKTTRTGYDFSGWYTDPTGGVAVTADTKVSITGPQTLYAHWIENCYSVVFHYYDGKKTAIKTDETKNPSLSRPFTQTVTVMSGGSMATGEAEIDTPTNAGYVFQKWIVYNGETEEDLTQAHVDALKNQAKDLDVYGRWEPIPYKIHYVFNYTGHTETTTPEEHKYDVDFNLETADHLGWKVTGYECLTWNTQADGKGTSYAAGSSQGRITTESGADVALYGIWTPKQYEVVFRKNDSGEYPASTPEPKSKKVTYDSTFGDLATISRTGFTFNGWRWGETGGDTVTKDTKVTIPSDQELFAWWTENTYTVKFDGNKGSGSTDVTGEMNDEPYTYSEKKALLANAYSRVGYDFDGWNTKADGTGEHSYTDKQEVFELSSADKAVVTLYAKWKPHTHKATFDGNGGEPVSKEVQQTFDAKYVLPAKDPTREGYTFSGWWTDASEGAQITEDTYFRTDDDSTKIYAHWTENTYKVTFEKNDETGSTKVKQDKMADEEFTFTESKALTANTYTRDGYTFKGWSTNKTGPKEYDDKQTVSGLAGKTKTNDELKLYAVWEANKYTVTFEKNDTAKFPAEDPVPASMEITFDQPYGTLAVISRECYTFDGWYTKDKGGTKVESTTAASIFADGTGAHTLYAHWTPVTYTITLKLRLNNHEPIDLDAEDYDPFEVYKTSYTVETDTFEIPATNTKNRPGYTYHGWYVTDPTKVSFTYEIEKGSHGNLTLIARYDIDQLHVNVDYNGGKVEGKTSDVIDFTVESHTKLTVPAYTEKPWLYFDGWKRTKAGEVEKDIPATEDFELVYADADAYYTAKWAKTEYSITYELNGPDVVNPEENTATYVYEETDRVLLDPSRAGYTFEGWFEDEDLTKAYPKIPAGTYDKALTVYAKWKANTYTVTFDKNSKFAADPDPATKDVIYDGTYGELAETTRTGYDFDGWWKDQTAEPAGGEVTASTVVKITGPQTLYAHWKAVNKTAKFHHNDGSDPEVTENITQTYDANYVLPASDPTRTGYTFAGWWTDPETGEQVKDTDVFTQTADQDIYAHWTANTYTVTFDKNDVLAADPEPATKDVTYDGTYGELAVTTKTGYEFAGWWKDPTAEPEDGEVTAFTEVKITGPQTLYAHWAPVTTTARFHGNGGTPEVSEVTQTYDAKYVLPEDPVREGYVFKGWWTDPEAGEQVTTDTPVTAVTDQDLHAHWEIGTFTITFDSDGGSTVAPVTQEYGTKVTAPEDPVREGYTFVQWNKDGSKYEFTTMPGEDVSLKAVWKINRHTITFDSNGGSAVAPITQDYGTKVKAPEDPVREGYTFVQWNRDGVKYEFGTIPDEDVALEAEWKINQYTITFDLGNGKTVTVTQDYGTPVKAPQIPAWEHHTCHGWDVPVPATMPAGDMIISAVWTVDAFNISYDLDGGVLIDPKTQYTTYEDFVLDVPERYSYDFLGWTGSNGDVPQVRVEIKKGTIGDLSFTAHWAYRQRSFNSAAPAGLRRYNAPGSGGGIISKGNWELIDQEDHRWKFHGDDGSLAKDGWYYLENPYTQNGNDRAWFCFDKNGFLIYGWIKGEGYTWYYANEYSDSDLGMLCYGWHYDRQDGKAYYLDPITGIMRWGWQKIDGYWYFFTAPEQTSGQTWFFNIHDILGTGLTWLGAWGYGQDPTRRPFGSMWVNEQTPDGRFVDEEGHLVGDL